MRLGRWKEFIHKTSHNVYAGTKHEQEQEEFADDSNHHFASGSGGRQEDVPIEDNVDEYLVGTRLPVCVWLYMCCVSFQ